MPENDLGINPVRARVLKLAFESLYGPFAWAYDWVSHTFFLGQWRLWQRAAIPHLLGPRVLEIGMGTGDLQADLREAGFEAWGIDLSPQMMRQAVRKARRAGRELRACRARAQALPFASGSFNSVVSTFPSEYIVDPVTLSEVSRVLEPGGRFVIVPGGWLRQRGTRGRAMERVARLVYGYRGKTDAEEIARRVEHHKGWYRWVSALQGRLHDAGFSLSARVASNRYGSCLVVVAERRD